MSVRRRLGRVTLAAGAVGVLAVANPATATTHSWTAQITLTPTTSGGYEPNIAIDAGGRIYVTAHKENADLVASADPSASTVLSAMSWVWMSKDGGRSFTELTGTPGAEHAAFGVEGDLATNGSGLVYLADVGAGAAALGVPPTDTLLSRWQVTQAGVTWLGTGIVGTGKADDRPWLVAHGHTVVYAANNGGDGKGSYAVYVSHDYGQTFHYVQTLAGSGWCRPAADPRPGRGAFVVLCAGDRGPSIAWVSTDDGGSFQRYPTSLTFNWWPSLMFDHNGGVWAVITVDNLPTTHVILARSLDRGRHWRQVPLALPPGTFEYPVIAVSPNGRLGFASFYRHDSSSAWRVLAGTWKPGARPALRLIDDPNTPAAAAADRYPSGDLMGCAFGPDNLLRVVWTRTRLSANSGQTIDVMRDIEFSQER
jgi:hypothetical protein